ncbi:hypothetical protein ABTN32_20530, partial [Acinetobacter baumannii]
LGGDNHGANPEQNIFAIESPVAVVVMARNGASNRKSSAKVHYRRVAGGADEKLQAMRAMAEAADPFGGSWQNAPDGWMDSFV